MAAAAQPNRREVIEFAPNTPVTVALKYAQGKTVSGMGGERVMLSTTDNRVMFLDPEVAGQIERAGINVRQPFTITQRWDGKKDSPRTWEVARIGAGSLHGELAAPASTSSTSGDAAGVRPKPVGVASSATSDDARSRLVQEANTLVDAYAEVLARALSKHEGRVKPDEVRSILLSAYIQRKQLSSVAA